MMQPLDSRDTSVTETLIDRLLAEQGQLTAVEKFGQNYRESQTPLLEAHYRDLIPLTKPRPGEQYAFEVNLDRCSGCKACVSACHSLNGLEEGESWRDVGTLLGEALVPNPGVGNRVIGLQQTVTTACHHCVEPGCLLGCPVLAYDKDPATGIVRHLDDQCIGCSYCILKCPYDVPKYSSSRGIVRKCDMCHGRLAANEAPACVQACPHEAIRITLVQTEAVKRESQSNAELSPKPEVRNSTLVIRHSSFVISSWLPDSPQPDITFPTTRYLSAKPIADLRAADHYHPRPAHAHWPLVYMLVFTQAGIGGLLAAAFSPDIGGQLALNLISFDLFAAGLMASVFHLGQPAKAWRVWLGWRTSWLSREAIALNVFGSLAAFALAAQWLSTFALPRFWITLGLTLCAATALVSQTMVYADTHREFWRFAATAPRFLGSTILLGTALLLVFEPLALVSGTLLLVTLCKLAVEVSVLKHADGDSDHWTQLRRTAVLQTRQLRPGLGGRLLCALFGGVLIPLALLAHTAPPVWGFPAAALCFVGEIMERYLFFASVAPDKMPGQA